MEDIYNVPPRGHLRLVSPHGFGRKIVAPLLSDFHDRYSEITLELLLSDRSVDSRENHIDLWFREGPVKDTGIVARPLMPRQLVVCASHGYVQTYGLPQSVDDLAHHRCINFLTASQTIQAWTFKIDGLTQQRQFIAQHTFNDASLIVQAVIDGLGIAQLPAYQVCGLLVERKLLRCLAQYAPDDSDHYLCYPNRELIPARIHVFVQYMTARMHTLAPE